MPSDNISHLQAATTRRQQQTRHRAAHALRQAPAGTPITVAGLARAAGVARSWLYTQPDLIAQIATHNHTATRGGPNTTRPASEDSWRHRAEAARQRVRELTTENTRLRTELAAALGAIRAHQNGPDTVVDTVHDASPQINAPTGGF